MIWVLVRTVLPCHSGGAREGYSFTLLARLDQLGSLEGGHGSSCSCGWIPWIDLGLDLISSGPGFVHHLVIWFARVLLLVRLSLPPRM